MIKIVIVLLLLSGCAPCDCRKRVKVKDSEIVELRQKVEMYEFWKCDGPCDILKTERDRAIKEVGAWREMAENCVDKKLGVKSR